MWIYLKWMYSWRILFSTEKSLQYGVAVFNSAALFEMSILADIIFSPTKPSVSISWRVSLFFSSEIYVNEHLGFCRNGERRQENNNKNKGKTNIYRDMYRFCTKHKPTEQTPAGGWGVDRGPTSHGQTDKAVNHPFGIEWTWRTGQRHTKRDFNKQFILLRHLKNNRRKQKTMTIVVKILKNIYNNSNNNNNNDHTKHFP